MILEVLLPSLLTCHEASLISLCVADAGSEDASHLKQKLEDALPGRVTFLTVEGGFSRSKLFNRAVQAAQTELLFITDADISLPPDLVEQVNRKTDAKRLWFPVCRAMLNASGSAWEWYSEGMGVMACTKTQYNTVGGYNEAFTTWGGEDQEFYLRCWKQEYFCLRTREYNLVHHWHPSQPGAKKQW